MITACAVLATLALPLQGGVYTAPDPEPTPEETLILELMNRFRADPSAEADRILAEQSRQRGVDWKMFEREMKALPSMPPLVFNLQLLDAARKHSHYTILNGMTHDETRGKPGFTGVTSSERCKRAGYAGEAGAENVYGRARDPWSSHAGFIIDSGQGPGGMRAGRGHRTNMISPFREVGPGALPHGGGGLAITHNFGSRAGRSAGGVVYIDHNKNAFYDIGEGIGRVAIRASNGPSMRTWKSGAYALELKGTGAVTLIAEMSGRKHTKTFPAGQDNVKFDWRIPVEVVLEVADKLIGAVEKAGEPGSMTHFRALIALVMGTEGLYVDETRKAKIGELVGDVRGELEAAQKEVLEAMASSSGTETKKLLSKHRATYRGTAAEAWFKDAEILAKLKRGVDAYLEQAKVRKPKSSDQRKVVAYLEAAERSMKTHFFRDRVKALLARVKGSG